MRFTFLVVLCVIFVFAAIAAPPAFAQTHKTIPLSDATDRALRESQLILPGSAPFHLKFSISETANPQSDHHAEVEEYWLAPDKYRRTIVSPAFSQTLIVNGSAVSETNTGDYYPYWLYQLITAVFDPVPFAPQLAQAKQETPEPSGGENDKVCGDIHMRVDRIIICFTGNGLLESVFTKGYDAQFRDYKKFGAKQVARRIASDPESEREIAATITLLDPLPQPDDSLFEVKIQTPPAERIQILRVGDDALRSLVIGSTEIDWPAVVGGQDSGGCGAFVSADRNGNIREAFSEGCDNFALQEPLRQALLKWKLKQAVVKGVPVQVTALMGFPFKVHVDPAPPVLELSDADARKLAKNKVDPVFPSGAKRGAKAEVVINVDDDGTLLNAGPGTNANHDTNLYFLPAYGAVSHWKFSPCIQDGKPVPFKATIIFTVP